jgi:hypothetical protein
LKGENFLNKNNSIKKSIIEQIYDEMFKLMIEGQKLKDTDIEILKKITYEENLKRVNSIKEVIKSLEYNKK